MILQVQTSKVLYLTSHSIRIEQVDLTDEESWDRYMDNNIAEGNGDDVFYLVRAYS